LYQSNSSSKIIGGRLMIKENLQIFSFICLWVVFFPIWLVNSLREKISSRNKILFWSLVFPVFVLQFLWFKFWQFILVDKCGAPQIFVIWFFILLSVVPIITIFATEIIGEKSQGGQK
jgi:hypothetical protein